MRRAASVAIAVALVVFMAAFMIEHAGILSPAHADVDDQAARLHVAGSQLRLQAGFSQIGASVRNSEGAQPPSPSIPALVRPVLGPVLLSPSFPRGTGLITNDFAYFNPDDRRAVRSPIWLVTSGSLFARNGAAWTGRPDSVRPNARSTNGTGSATFRVVTRPRDFENVAVSFDLLTRRLLGRDVGAIHNWDGVHVFLHYRSQHSLYVVTLVRRDGLDVVKKKRPGGSANGGTYITLGSPTPERPAFGRWQHFLVTIRTLPQSGTVSIAAYLDNRRLLSVVDKGRGGSPLNDPGAVGIRGDNADFEFAHFQISALG
jgi:hypothetical protein